MNGIAGGAFAWGGSTFARRFLGTLVLVAGLGLLAFVALNLGQDASLWFFGRRAEAEVVGKWIERDAEERLDEPTFRYFLRYRFETPDGRVVTGVSRVAAQEWSAIQHAGAVDVVSAEEGDLDGGGVGTIEGGGSVDVVYFPAYPAHNRLDESQFVAVVACAYVPLIALACTGLVAGRRLLLNL